MATSTSSARAAATSSARRASPVAARAAAAAAPAAGSSSASMGTHRHHVVVVGAGIVGSSAAFFLRRADPSLRVTLVDAAAEVASAASGKAGGFLARDWSGDPLMRAGFDLHDELAREFGAEEVGYRRMKTLSASFSMTATTATAGKKSSSSSSSPPSAAPWLSPAASRLSQMGDEATTAQVHPGLLTKKLAEGSGAAMELGAEVRGLSFFLPGGASPSASRGQVAVVTGVSLLDGRELPADAVVLALGPWLGQAARAWELPRGVSLPEVSGQRAHSVILRPRGGGRNAGVVSATAVFSAVARSDRVAEPEFYPRPDGTVYVCGESDDASLPAVSNAAAAAAHATAAGDGKKNNTSSSSSSSFDPKRTAMLRDMAAAVSPAALACPETAELVSEQACYLPLPPQGGNGLPIIGLARGADNLFVCGGHSCWGILKGPVSGKRVAEMVVEKLREKKAGKG